MENEPQQQAPPLELNLHRLQPYIRSPFALSGIFGAPACPLQTSSASSSSSSSRAGSRRLSARSSLQLLACVLWVLKHLEPALLAFWLAHVERISRFVDLLALISANFDYKVCLPVSFLLPLLYV